MNRTPLRQSRRVVCSLVILSGLLVASAHLNAVAQNDTPGGKILFVRDGNVWIWEAGDTTEVFSGGTASDARWSPDGDQVLYVANQQGYSDLMLYDLGTGTYEQLTENAPPADLEPGSQAYVNRSSWARDPAWSASGRIAFVADYEESGRMALWLIESPGEPAIIAPELEPEEIDIEGVSLSESGALAAYTVKTFDGVDYHTEVVLRDLSDGAVYPMVDEPGGVYDPAISPDEQEIAVTIRGADGTSNIWLVSRADGSGVQLTFGGQAVAAAWSPDGSWLAYLQPSGDGFGLWALPIGLRMATGEPISLGEWDGMDATSGLSWTDAT